jgi:hypothetical protein
MQGLCAANKAPVEFGTGEGMYISGKPNQLALVESRRDSSGCHWGLAGAKINRKNHRQAEK